MLPDAGRRPPEHARIFGLPRSVADTEFRAGDKLLVDITATRPSPHGIYLYVSGGALKIALMALVPNPRGEQEVAMRLGRIERNVLRARPGSSATAQGISARDALRMKLQGPKNRVNRIADLRG
jgi:hypothetical protein